MEAPSNPSRERRRRRRRRPSAAKSSRPHLRWVILDGFVHRTKGAGDGVEDGTLSEISYTCAGKPIRASLRVADPPAVSRLHLHWPDGDRIIGERPGPSVIAAHGHSILLRTHVPLVQTCDPSFYPIDYFVYTASLTEQPPSFTRLPPCFLGGLVRPEEDMHFEPYRFHQLRLMPKEEIGLLCHGDEFTVAELSCPSPDEYVAELCVLHGAPGVGSGMQWRVKKLPMPCMEGTAGLLTGSWRTDLVIPFGACYLCWVDCYQGMLFADVLGERTKLRYVPLPASLALDSHRLYIDRECPDLSRRVCVTDAGMIKFVCVSNGAGCSCSASERSCFAFTVTVWTLVDFKQMKWEKDGTMEASEFWDLDFDKRLPRVLPEFPLVSLGDPDVICLVLNDNYRLFWLVEVNMKNKMLGAITLYIQEEEEEGSTEMGRRKWISFYGCGLIPSQFTRYLNKHAIRSLAFSEMLQKAKLQRAMQKGWIENPIERMVRQIEESP